MKVLDLCCAHGHTFEGWFASEEDFLSQQERHLVSCPLCGDAQVVRRPSAARLNLAPRRGDSVASAASAPPPPSAQTPPAPAPWPPQEVQKALMSVVREVLKNTEDVGERFVEEARRIHYGEAESRNIRGQATPQERESLRDEGIDVFALPVPEGLSGPTH